MSRKTVKEINKEIFRIMLPSIGDGFLQTIAATITTAMVGRLLSVEISGQGISNRVTTVGWALFKGISIAVTVIIATYFGAKRKDKCRNVTEQAYLFLLPFAVVLSLLVMVFGHQIVGLFTTFANIDPAEKAAISEVAYKYLMIGVWIAPGSALMQINSATYFGHKDTRTPLYISVFYNVVNIILSYVFIFGVGPIGGWGVTGAAIAQVCSQTIGGLAGLFLLYRRRGLYGDKRVGRFFRYDFKEIKNILSTGVPAAAEQVLWQVVNIFLTMAILNYGANVNSAFAIAGQAENIFGFTAWGYTTAAITLTGLCVGARDKEGFYDYFKNLLRLATIMSGISSILIFVFGRTYMHVMTTNEELWDIGLRYVLVMGAIQIPQGLNMIFNGMFRSVGKKQFPVIVTFIGLCFIRLPVMMLASFVFHAPVMVLWLAMALDHVVRFVCEIVYYFRQRRYIDNLLDSPINVDDPMQKA